MGLLGLWGEWHTWPHEDWFPTQETQMTVLNAFDAAFQTTQMQVRLPHANSLNLRMGFHDAQSDAEGEGNLNGTDASPLVAGLRAAISEITTAATARRN